MSIDSEIDPLLTEKEYRAWLGISAPTAQRQRADGSGPPFVQISQRRIGYRKSQVERWMRERTISRRTEQPSQQERSLRNNSNKHRL